MHIQHLPHISITKCFNDMWEPWQPSHISKRSKTNQQLILKPISFLVAKTKKFIPKVNHEVVTLLPWNFLNTQIEDWFPYKYMYLTANTIDKMKRGESEAYLLGSMANPRRVTKIMGTK